MKSTYIAKLIRTVLVAVIAGMATYFLFGQDLMLAIAFAGLPTGWRVLSNFFGRWVISGNMMLVYLCFKAILACLLGWIILPIDLISTAIKLVTASKEQAA
ncbi:MAG: hypothetical protein IKT52_07670 [Oscillospiraceae bacterium]|nr:hypothetical protein [Oscillospiraceae bacterium]